MSNDKKPYNHGEVMRLLDRIEVCATSIRNINLEFQKKVGVWD